MAEAAVYLNQGGRFRMFPFAGAAGRRFDKARLAVMVAVNESGEAWDHFRDSLVRQEKKRGQRDFEGAEARVDWVRDWPHRDPRQGE